VAGEDGEGAVDLFGEDDLRELMRQGDAAEGEEEVGAGAGGVGPTVGRADGEDEALGSGVAVPPDGSGELFRGELLASAVEQDEECGSAAGLAVE